MSELTPPREHFYHAEATVLSGHLHLPLEHTIRPQAFAKLPEHGGYLSQQSKDYRLESVISYASAHTQVGGNRETKPGHGWSTLVTSVVEELNILDVITADRVVAQVSTEHPVEGYVPSITFLGTRFENLRIAGHLIRLDLDLNIFGGKPDNDGPYTKNPAFLKRVAEQHSVLRGQLNTHPHPEKEFLERYNHVPESFVNSTGAEETLQCSLVNSVDTSAHPSDDHREAAFPGHCFGHVIHVPNFGTIHLATLHLRHSDYHPRTHVPQQTHVHLNMIEAKMGCIATGTATVGQMVVNGRTKP